VDDFIDYLHDVFSPFGVIRTRKMFGGYGVYHNDVMFALVAEGTLYLKSDETIETYFKQRNLQQFEYSKANKPVKMSYFAAPEEIYEDPDQAVLWAQRSYEAGMRSGKKQPVNR
jgi:DNA transformation protein